MHQTHGLSQTPEYKCWQQIKARCLNPNHIAYPDYGGRGISIHPDWQDNFPAFLEHVGSRPSKHYSLDRIRNDRGYEPGNVRWATRLEQNNNRRAHRSHGVKPTPRPVRDDGRPTNYKHGLIHTPEYNAWTLMKDRCLNPRSSNYPGWGGRGIKVHPPWIEDFTVFYLDVGPRPTPTHSLDRWPDMNGNYEPGNVRWATKKEQTDNRRPCKTGPSHKNFEHGYTTTPEYKTWGSIKTRCFNPKHDGYARYGAVGITMCLGWRESFESFLQDLGTKPTSEHNVLRMDNEKGYTCGKCTECTEQGWVANCRWGTRTEVNRNRKTTFRTGKLDIAKVRIIRSRLAKREKPSALASEFGVNPSVIAKIKRKEIWQEA